MRHHSPHPNILAYLDYRHYLSDLYASFKKSDAKFSFRAFARIAGSTSPNYLQLIQDRKLNISASAISSLSTHLNLSAKERHFFETIVAFDHAKTSDEKDHYLQRVLDLRKSADIKQLQKEQYQFFSHWYIPVIRELVTCDRYPDDPAWLAEQVIPAITESKARKAVELLESLDLIRRDPETGRWAQTDKVISTPTEVHSLAVTAHTKSIFSLGRDAVDRFGPAERDLRGITVGISSDAYPELKRRMEEFWTELLAFAQKQQKVDRVYQIDFGIFPVSRPPEVQK